MKKIVSLLVLLTVVYSNLQAQELLVLQPEDPSFLPKSAVNIVKTPSYTPKSKLINLMEQKGLYPYQGHTCSKASSSFEEGANGKQYGNNEFASINVNVQQYGSEGKILFDNQKPWELNKTMLNDFAASSQNEPDAGSGRVSREVKKLTVKNGSMVIVMDKYNCTDSEYGSYVSVFFRSIALQGTTIITINGSYFSESASLAEKIHTEVVENVNSVKM